jgi:hypothetical protein
MRGEVRTLTIAGAHVGTQPAAYGPWVSVARVRVKRTFGMSFATEMHTTWSKTVAKNEVLPNVNATMRGTMIIMALTMTNPTNIILWLEDAMNGESSLSLTIWSQELRSMMGPPTWLSGSRFINSSLKSQEGTHMTAHYLLICLSPLARTCLMGLGTGLVGSWSDLCWQFISNFWATCVQSGVDWDLASVVQKKGESLLEFIQHFCNMRNIIPKVDDKSIIMFFKKWLRDSSLIHKLTMKNPRTSEEMLAIGNKYALAEEVTLSTRD